MYKTEKFEKEKKNKVDKQGMQDDNRRQAKSFLNPFNCYHLMAKKHVTNQQPVEFFVLFFHFVKIPMKGLALTQMDKSWYLPVWQILSFFFLQKTILQKVLINGKKDTNNVNYLVKARELITE